MTQTRTNRPFEASLTDELMRMLNLMRYAFGGGIVLFGAAVIVIHFLQGAPSDGETAVDVSLITTLSVIHAFTFAIGWLVAPHVERGLLGVGRFKKMGPQTDLDVNGWQEKVRASWLTGLAIREGIAFFGLVICMLSIFMEIMPDNSLYWLNFMSPLLFVYYAFSEAPTSERFTSLYYSEDDRIL